MTRPFNPLGLRALRHVSLNCTDLDAARSFYLGPWQLEAVHDDDTSLFLRGTGPEHHVVAFHAAPSTGLRHLGFALGEPADVDWAAEHLIKRGISLEEEPGAIDEPGGGYVTSFRDPENRLIRLVAKVDAVAPRPTDLPRPIGLSHVVLNTVDIGAAVEFWTDVVGLRISDWSEDQMVFLRCNNVHHSIAFNQAQWTSVNHIAYDVSSVDHFLQTVGHLRHGGIEPLWGVGQHGPGANPFAYYGDPVGYVPEVTTGLTIVDEATWIPRVWQRVPDQSDLWGTAGPPSTEVRTAMAGQPDPGATT